VPPAQADILSTKQTAKLIGRSAAWLYKNRRSGPPYRKIGKRCLYVRKDVEDWFEECRVA